MLSLDPDKLAEEVRKAEDFRRKHTLRSRSIVERFIGNWYRVDVATTATPENTVFAYIAYMLPNLWFSNPSCRVEARRPQSHAQIADAMESALRGWFAETTFTQEGQEIVRDALMGYGVMQVGIEPRDFPGDRLQEHAPPMQGPEVATADPGDSPAPPPPQQQDDSDGALRPFAVRLSPEQLIMDPLCEDPTKARFMGHTYFKDLDQVQAEAEMGMWDKEAVGQLSAVSRDGDGTQNEKALPMAQIADRNRVALVDLWIPERNMLVTLARHYGASNFILRQTSYWGPPEGPYEVFGCYVIPGDPYPMGPLQPIMEQLEEMWAHQRQASADASLYKRFILVEEGNTNLGRAILDAKGGGVYGVRGLTDYREVEVGGTPEGRLAHIASLRDRADRTIGLSDAQRGRVQGKTATENDIVQGNVDTRTSLMRQRVQWHTTRVLNRVCWFFFFDDTIAMPVTSTDPFTGKVTEGTFLGGIQPGQQGIRWVDFNLSIEPTSMVYTDDATLVQRAQTLAQLAQEVGELMPQMSFVNWRYIVNMFGDAYNQKNLFDILFNQQAIAQFQQMPQAFGYAAPGTTPLPGGVNPGLLASGMGAPGGPAPSWGGGAPGGAIGPGSAGGTGAMPGMPPMGAGGGAPVSFAPRRGGVMGPPGQPAPSPRTPMMRAPMNRPLGRPTQKLLTGNPRTQKNQAASGAAKPMHTGNPRAAKKTAAAGGQSFV